MCFFETLHDPEQMPGQSNRRLGGGIAYPYVEGLRIDEAMNPLSLMSAVYMVKRYHHKMVRQFA